MFYKELNRTYYEDGSVKFVEGYKIKPSNGGTWKVCFTKSTIWADIYTKTLVDGLSYEECERFIQDIV